MKTVALLVALLFGLGGVAEAKPESVDWSQYLETKSDKPLVKTSPQASKKKVAKAKAKPSKKRTAARAKKRR